MRALSGTHIEALAILTFVSHDTPPRQHSSACRLCRRMQDFFMLAKWDMLTEMYWE
eukprot:gene7984-17456_t